MNLKLLTLVTVLASVPVLSACGNRFLTGAAVGAGAAATGYEISNKQALDKLEADYRAGRISRAEYLRRRKEIEDRSVVY